MEVCRAGYDRRRRACGAAASIKRAAPVAGLMTGSSLIGAMVSRLLWRPAPELPDGPKNRYHSRHAEGGLRSMPVVPPEFRRKVEM